MSDIQDSILCLNFTQMLPKTILDKISSQENNEDGKPKIAEGKDPGKNGQGGDNDKQDIVLNNDKNIHTGA